MSGCCCPPLGCCCSSKTKNGTENKETEHKPKKSKIEKAFKKINKMELKLKRVQRYGNCIVQTVIASFLFTIILWLLVRVPEPQVHVTRFVVEALTPDKLNASHALTYDITIHNPDLFKYLYYNVLIAKLHLASENDEGYTFDFINDVHQLGKGFHQRPGKTTTLPNHSVTTDWSIDSLASLVRPEGSNAIVIAFVMEIHVKAFNIAITKRQVMRMGQIFFYAYNIKENKHHKITTFRIANGTYGEAFIPRGGLRLS